MTIGTQPVTTALDIAHHVSIIFDEGFSIVAKANGSVGVAFRHQDTSDPLPSIIDGHRLRQAWTLADELVHELAGYGPAYPRVQVDRANDIIGSSHWVSTNRPTDDDLGKVVRALRRHTGDAALEDEGAQ